MCDEMCVLFKVCNYMYPFIGVAPITQLRTCVMKKSNIQGRSPNVVKVISIP